MSACDELREALNAVTAKMNEAIALARELGREADRDQLITQRTEWVRTGNRVCNGAGPRGRLAVPPIVPASYSLKPPVRARVRQERPHLRVVELEPFSVTIDRVVLEAQRAQRASRKLLRDCEQERGAPDAG